MDIKRAETKFILTQAVCEAWAMFKRITWSVLVAFVIIVIGLGVNWLFALALFVGVPVVVGLGWAVIYRWCFDVGALKLEQTDKNEKDDGKGDE